MLVPSPASCAQPLIPALGTAAKGFQTFLASSACVASGTSYYSCSAAPLSWLQRFLVGCALVQVRALPFGLRV
ncbi:DUF1010 domain-containing protein [Providencia huaxiensis]